MGEGRTVGRDGAEPKRRLTVSEAAAELGTTSEGVRSRIKRGTLRTERESGRVWVILEGAPPRPGDAPPRPDAAQPGDRAELIDELRDRVAFLEAQLKIRTEENRRKDHLLAAALERIPPSLQAAEETEGIEAPAEPPPDEQGSPETAEAQASSAMKNIAGNFVGLVIGAIFTVLVSALAAIGGFIYSVISVINGDQEAALIGAIVGVLGAIGGATLLGIYRSRRRRARRSEAGGVGSSGSGARKGEHEDPYAL